MRKEKYYDAKFGEIPFDDTYKKNEKDMYKQDEEDDIFAIRL